MCEDQTFQALCSYLAACQPDFFGVYCALPLTGNATKRYILVWYEAMRSEVKKQLMERSCPHGSRLPDNSCYECRARTSFSGAKTALSDRRCRMGDNALEVLECLQGWQRDGLIAGTRGDIGAVEEALHAFCEEDLQQ